MIYLLPPIIVLLVFTYHYERNGNPWNFGGLISRLIWSFSMGIAYLTLGVFSKNLSPSLWIMVGSFAAILIPHAVYQNMGRWPNVQWKWVGFFLPKYTQQEWSALASWKRTAYDFMGMGAVGLWRGIIVFVPLVFFGFSWLSVLSATVLNGLMQPLMYLIGYYIPFNIWNNKANSSEWGEFGIGIGWALALALLIWA